MALTLESDFSKTRSNERAKQEHKQESVRLHLVLSSNGMGEKLSCLIIINRKPNVNILTGFYYITNSSETVLVVFYTEFSRLCSSGCK